MENKVNEILNTLLAKKYINATTLYKFFKKNVLEVDELLCIVDKLIEDDKISGNDGFVLIEYISSFKLDITINPGDIWHPIEDNPWIPLPYTSPYTKNPWDFNSSSSITNDKSIKYILH